MDVKLDVEVTCRELEVTYREILESYYRDKDEEVVNQICSYIPEIDWSSYCYDQLSPYRRRRGPRRATECLSSPI